MDYVFDNLSLAKDRLVTNSIKSFEGMTTQRWVRLVAIIGGYMLLRPWLLKFAADRQKKQFEKESEELGLSGPSANDLRGGKGKKGEKKGEGKVLGEIKEGKKVGEKGEAPKAPRVTKRKGAGKKMLEEEEADEEREIRAFLDEQRSGLAT